MVKMKKRGDALMNFIIVFIVVVVIAVIIIIFNQKSVGMMSGVLSANNMEVKAAAAGCGFLSSDDERALCTDFKMIAIKGALGGIFGSTTHYVNCDYLYNKLKLEISNGDKFKSVNCSNYENITDVKCDALLKENVDNPDYIAFVNGVKCSAKDKVAKAK